MLFLPVDCLRDLALFLSQRWVSLGHRSNLVHGCFDKVLLERSYTHVPIVCGCFCLEADLQESLIAYKT